MDQIKYLYDKDILKKPRIRINTAGVGFVILDQTQRDFLDVDEINVTRSVLLKKLHEIANYTDVCGVTLTLKQKFHNENPIDIHRYIQMTLNKSYIWQNMKYILIPEFSSKGGHLHYHGVIWDSYQSEVMRGVNWWRRTYGFVKPEIELHHYDLWIKYIIKDYGKTGLWTLYKLN